MNDDYSTYEVTSHPDNAVNHYADWGAGHWTLWLTFLAISLVALGFAYSRFNGQYGGFGPLEVAAGIGALVLFPWSLYQLTRHSSTWSHATSTALVAAIVVTALAIYYGFFDSLRRFALAAGPFLAIAFFLTIWDGLNRVASWVPTTVGTVVLAIIAIGLYAAFGGQNQRRSAW